jgi:hypothetical protein
MGNNRYGKLYRSLILQIEMGPDGNIVSSNDEKMIYSTFKTIERQETWIEKLQDKTGLEKSVFLCGWEIK